MPSDPTSREYRDSVGMFTTGITVVTAASERFGHGMTANAFASVSLDPLLVLVCVVKDALMHKVLDEVGRFAVSVLAGDQEVLARYFSDSGRPTGMAQFVPVAWHPGPVTGAPPWTAPWPTWSATSRRPTTAATTRCSWAGSAGSSGPTPAASRSSTSAAATGAWRTRSGRPAQASRSEATTRSMRARARRRLSAVVAYDRRR